MKKREAAIVTAYTGILLGHFSETHKYAQEVLERPVYTHEFAGESFTKELKEASKADFVGMLVED